MFNLPGQDSTALGHETLEPPNALTCGNAMRGVSRKAAISLVAFSVALPINLPVSEQVTESGDREPCVTLLCNKRWIHANGSGSF